MKPRWLVAKRLGRVISLVEKNKTLESFVEINYDVLPVALMPTDSLADERESCRFVEFVFSLAKAIFMLPRREFYNFQGFPPLRGA